MITHNSDIANKDWLSLVSILSGFLDRDETNLGNNLAYYMKLRDNPDADQKKIQNAYDKLEYEQRRFQCFNEIFFRLNDPDIQFLLAGIEEIWHQQRNINPVLPEDYVVYYRKYQDNRKVYYLPL
ncbi:MAG TPA: hypothetical protein DIT07_08600 [Sphingobacteriaceae bacterium]|nr:hypothetical protein [Sphingobacteriaceae bacterium]